MKELLVKWKILDKTKYNYIDNSYFPTGLGVFLSMILIGVSVIAFAAPIAYQACQNSAEIVGMDYEWDFFAGCFYEYEGQMLPDDVWETSGATFNVNVNE